MGSLCFAFKKGVCVTLETQISGGRAAAAEEAEAASQQHSQRKVNSCLNDMDYALTATQQHQQDDK